MKKLLFAIAGAAAFAVLAADPAARTVETGSDITVLGFENFQTTDVGVVNKDDSGGNDTSYWSVYPVTGEDNSLVKAYGVGENAAAPTGISFPAPFTDAGNNYLALDTNGAELQREIPAAGQAVAADGTYIDTLIQFTPSESAPTDLDGAKIAIWLGVENNVTNLMVRGAFYTMTDGTDSESFNITTPTNYVLSGTYEPNTWYRLTIKNVQTLMNGMAGQYLPGFVITVDGQTLAATAAAADATAYSFLTSTMGEGDEAFTPVSGANKELLDNRQFIPSLGASDMSIAPTITAVGFKGTGALDDFVVTTIAPDFTPAGIDFTLTWPQGYTPVSYTIDGGTPVTIDGNTTFPISVPDGSTVAFTFQNADGATKTMSATASSSVNEIDASTATYVWADYLGDAVNGAYTIDDANDLDMLRKGVLANLATLGETFKQTANIDMSQAGPFAGIGTYAANASAGLPFQGTYDGQGFKISDIDFTQRNYGGVFNQVKGGAIKNLTVENITCSTFASDVNSGEWGCAIVGNAGLGTTLQNLTAMGSFGTAAIPCRHNVAGIAIRLSGGASNVVDGVEVLETLVKDCTNNATLYGSYTKAAGITALTQDQNGVPNDYVLFDGCVNNANIAMVAGKGTEGRDGLGGILGYVADGTKMQNCVNNGTLTSVLATAKIGELIGWAQGRTLDDLGGNVASAAKKMIGDPAGSTITGFKYATVADNKATTVLPPLTVGATYLLEGAVGASDDTGVTLADGQTIAFDAALDNAYTFSGIVGAAAPLVAIPSTSGTITTFSAGYFPRTATAGQDGSAANPFELADADDLQALKAAFGTAAYRAYNYKVVANIDATDLGYWDGIGTQGTANTGLNGGTLDGSGYTISNLKFSAGKYRGFFNRMDNATIKDLTINVVDIAQTTDPEHGYAAFVGNMDHSTLLNCTATGTIGTTAKPAMHTCAGFAVKVNAAGVFVNCTNHIDIVCSLTDNPKIGGIVGLMQGGALTNCWNDGDLTITVKVCANNGNGAGGLVGYAQTTGYTISGGGNAGTIQSTDTTPTTETTAPIHVGTIVGMTGSALTAVDGVVAPADAVSAGVRNNVNGLDFATVDNNVATFVPNASLAAGNTYKVMLGGATANYAFTEAGTIAFDTNLVQDVTFNITGPEGLTVTDATVDGVVTFTAGSAGGYPTYLTDADADVKAAYDTWKVANGADTNSEYENQFLVNAAPATVVPATALAITAIEQNATAGWDITVECTVSGVDLAGQVGTAKAGNGYLAVSYTDDLGGTWTTENINITASANGKVTVNVNKSGAKFMKVKLSATTEPVAQP